MLNHITVMGRLTRDPELRRTGSGIAVANFTLAVERDFASKEGGEKETDFIDCVAWKSTGEFVSRYFQKGSMAAVAGRLQSRKWKDKDGNNRITWEIVAENVYFAERKQNSDSGRNASYGGNSYGGNTYSAPAGNYDSNASYGGGSGRRSYEPISGDDVELPF